MANLPQWTRNGDTFWKRTYTVAVATETETEVSLDDQLAEWLAKVEREDGVSEPE